MYRRIYAYGAAAFLACAHHDRSGTRDQDFATGDGGIALSQTAGRKIVELVSGKQGLKLFFTAEHLLPIFKTDQVIQSGDQFLFIQTKNEFALQIAELLGEFNVKTFVAGFEDRTIALTGWKRNRR